MTSSPNDTPMTLRMLALRMLGAFMLGVPFYMVFALYQGIAVAWVWALLVTPYTGIATRLDIAVAGVLVHTLVRSTPPARKLTDAFVIFELTRPLLLVMAAWLLALLLAVPRG